MDYDMAGLAMYDGGMGAWLSPEMLKQQLFAGAAGAGGILVVSAVLSRLPLADWLPETTSPQTVSRVKNALAIGLGVVGGRMIWEKNPTAAMGFVGGVAGLGLAQLIQSFAPESLSTNLSGGLADMDLASLEAAVSHQSPAFAPGLMGSTVTERALAAPGVSSEQLANAGYASYLS